MEDGRYRIEIVMSDGQIHEFHFLLATTLYARPHHVRSVLGNVLDPFVTEEEIGMALWQATARVADELSNTGMKPEDMAKRLIARQRYTTYLAAADLLRRRLIELGASPAEEERKMGDSSARKRYDLRILRGLLDSIMEEEERWWTVLTGGTKILGAVRGGTVNVYPLTGRVW